MNQAVERAERHAVVIGGSMAGLLAARVLADHFDRVTLIERDVYPDKPDARPGVPQMRHLHGLLARGQIELEVFFPGLGSDLDAAGAQRLNILGDTLWLSPTTWGRRDGPGLDVVACSRALLDWHVRKRVAALDRVTIREGLIADGLLMTEDGLAVAGVRARPRRPALESTSDETQGEPVGHGEEVVEIAADLVVDASGRGSRVPEWLASAGYPVPEETRIDPFLGYASRLYEPPEGVDFDWKFLVMNARAPNTRGGGILTIEGGKWIALAVGYGRDYPPTDDAGFLEFARGMRTPFFAQVLSAARPLSPIYGYRQTQNRWRHYERVARRPEGLLVTGDAAVAFNPTYGQGMSVAAVEARALDTCLREQSHRVPDGTMRGLAGRFQPALAQVTSVPWLMATGEDVRFPTTEGPRPGAASRLAQRYSDRILAVATEDPVVGMAFWRVAHLLAPISSLFAPSVLVRALAPRKSLGLIEPPTRTGLPLTIPVANGNPEIE